MLLQSALLGRGNGEGNMRERNMGIRGVINYVKVQCSGGSSGVDLGVWTSLQIFVFKCSNVSILQRNNMQALIYFTSNESP